MRSFSPCANVTRTVATLERLGINAQVGDLFHGRLDTGVPSAYASPNRITMLQSCKRWYTGAPMGLRLGEALGTPFSRTARYKFRSAIPFMAGWIPAVPVLTTIQPLLCSNKRWDLTF